MNGDVRRGLVIKERKRNKIERRKKVGVAFFLLVEGWGWGWRTVLEGGVRCVMEKERRKKV